MSAPEPEGAIWHTDPGACHISAVEPTLIVNVCLDATIVDGNVNTFAGAPFVNSFPSMMSTDHFDVPQTLWLPASLDFTSSATLSAHYQQH